MLKKIIALAIIAVSFCATNAVAQRDTTYATQAEIDYAAVQYSLATMDSEMHSRHKADSVKEADSVKTDAITYPVIETIFKDTINLDFKAFIRALNEGEWRQTAKLAEAIDTLKKVKKNDLADYSIVFNKAGKNSFLKGNNKDKYQDELKEASKKIKEALGKQPQTAKKPSVQTEPQEETKMEAKEGGTNYIVISAIVAAFSILFTLLIEHIGLKYAKQLLNRFKQNSREEEKNVRKAKDIDETEKNKIRESEKASEESANEAKSIETKPTEQLPKKKEEVPKQEPQKPVPTQRAEVFYVKSIGNGRLKKVSNANLALFKIEGVEGGPYLFSFCGNEQNALLNRNDFDDNSELTIKSNRKIKTVVKGKCEPLSEDKKEWKITQKAKIEFV